MDKAFYLAGDRFPSGYLTHDVKRRARHGQVWSSQELRQLEDLYHSNAPLREMCETLERPADGVMIKLRYIGLVSESGGVNICRVTANDSKTQMPQDTPRKAMTSSIQEQTMSERKTIEQVTLIQGQDATTLSDEQIFSLIAKTEAKIASLQSIKAKSTKIQGAIDALQKDVNALVEYVDNRVQ